MAVCNEKDTKAQTLCLTLYETRSQWLLKVHYATRSIHSARCERIIAKILEKLVLSQVSFYLNSHNLYNTCQSAYRLGHSTETALLKVANDLFLSLNKGNISVLALLDFFKHLTQLIILSFSILTLDLLIMSSNGFHLI